MNKNKIKEFLKDNWSNVAIVGTVVATETMVLAMYKKFLKGLEENS